MVPLEDFDFEGYKYTIVSYDFMTVVGGNLKRGTANGSKFNSDVNSYINALGRGQTLNFTNIRVKGSENANQNYNEISPHTSQNGCYQKVYKQ